jgi:hypothetical protein
MNENTSIRNDRDKLFYIFSNCDYNFKAGSIPKTEYLEKFVKEDDSELVQILLQNRFMLPAKVKPMIEIAQKNNAFKVVPLLLSYTKK